MADSSTPPTSNNSWISLNSIIQEDRINWIVKLFGHDFLMAWLVRGSISMIPITHRVLKERRYKSHLNISHTYAVELKD